MVIFAVPNVIGAAAMGWLLKGGVSQTIVVTHRLTIKAFSAVTATFQIFFAAWALGHAENVWWLCVVIALSAAMFYAIHAKAVTQVILAICIFIVSIVMFAAGHDLLKLPHIEIPTTHEFVVLASLVPVCLFGFVFCPYLDSTFHIAATAVAF